MIKVINGDVDKFGVLYERYKTPLYGYFFKLTKGDISSSEDLVQGVFYKALKYKHSFKGTGEFSKWLFSIAHNLGIDHARKMSRNASQEISDNLVADDSNEMDRIERREELLMLRQAMKELDPADKEVLILAKIKYLKYKDIAEILNISETAVKARIFRAIKRLKDYYIRLETYNYER